MINQSDLVNINLGAPTVTSPQPAGPGGNTIVPVPATANEWPKMLIAIAILAGGVWVVSNFNDEASMWVAGLVLLAMVTYYETHGNKRFSEGVKNLLGAIK